MDSWGSEWAEESGAWWRQEFERQIEEDTARRG
jgi:hypothetical protein